MEPKISIVTVCYNAVSSIEKTMLSVLNQTYDNIEYIIIDGGSTDGTIDVIKKYAGRLAYWISEPDKGIYDAMNKGIMVAKGDYINFMNSGDTFFDNTVIQRAVNSIGTNRPTVIYGDTLEVYENKQFIRKALDPKHLTKKGILCHQSALINVAYHKAHTYDLNFRILADFNFFFNAYNLDKQIFYRLNTVISRFSMKDRGLSKLNYDNNYQEFFRIISPNISPLEKLLLNIRRILGKIKRSLLS